MSSPTIAKSLLLQLLAKSAKSGWLKLKLKAPSYSMIVFSCLFVHSGRHKKFVSGLARALTLYVSSIHLSDSSATDALLALKTGE